MGSLKPQDSATGRNDSLNHPPASYGSLTTDGTSDPDKPLNADIPLDAMKLSDPDKALSAHKSTPISTREMSNSIRQMMQAENAFTGPFREARRRCHEPSVLDGTYKMGIIRTFVINVVDKQGHSSLLDDSITKISIVSGTMLTVYLPWILFVCKTAQALELVGETIRAHLGLLINIPEICVEFEPTAELCVGTSFSLWQIRNDAHGEAEGAGEVFRRWMQAASLFPSHTKMLMVFSTFWTNYEALRSICKEANINKPNIFFQFRIQQNDKMPDVPFHMKQTITAVANIESNVRSGIDPVRRDELLSHGCRGFEKDNPQDLLSEIGDTKPKSPKRRAKKRRLA